MAIRKLCEKSGVSTGAFYHHYHSKEDLPSQGFASFDQELQAYLAQADDADTVGMIRFVVLSLNQYVFDNAAGFAKELYISQLSIKDSYITRKDRPYNRAGTGGASHSVRPGQRIYHGFPAADWQRNHTGLVPA